MVYGASSEKNNRDLLFCFVITSKNVEPQKHGAIVKEDADYNNNNNKKQKVKKRLKCSKSYFRVGPYNVTTSVVSFGFL